ncbi:nucleoid-associated protein [Actinobacillus genomosp. 1]|nr:nucleoid-associated protein [Actinobacillus genomosp. 1]WGE33406.1 nucleoid-associated protein [Actinobacillus genomosp. 1]
MYQDNIKNKKYFVCVIFKQNAGISIDANLDLQDAIYVELKKLQQAFIIDLNIYNAFLRNNKSEEYDSYIRFLSQTNNYSDYFIDAFGCDNSSKPDKVTENILQGIYDYFIEKGKEINSLEIKHLALSAKKKIVNFLKNSNAELSLDKVKDTIKSFLLNNESELEQVNLDIEEFSNGIVSYLHENEKYKIPFYFSISKNILKKHLGNKIEDENKRWTLNTEYGIIGKTDENNKTIILDQTNKTILIKDVSAKSIEKFIKEMEKHNNDSANS